MSTLTAYRAGTACLGACLGASLLALHSSRTALRAATTDPVTKLPTRARWRTAAARTLHTHGGYVGMLDLRGFKTINDTHGHHIGDRLLAAIGTRLATALPGRSTCCRWGGDEFAVHTPIALDWDRLLDDLAMPLHVTAGHERLEFHIRASLGIAEARPGTTIDELLHSADDAMYGARLLRRDWSAAA